MPETPSHLDRLKAALADRYVIERELGSGGMAIVYLAEDRKYQRKVAVKVLRPELAAAVGAERFLREIQIAARLTHPHILPLLDSGDVAGLLYYVMPYVEGESLRERLNRETQLPVEDTVQITREVGDALSYAHSRGVVHRDIKPENILLSPGGAILADFGVARALDSADTGELTATGIAIGTPAYMSPEQASGQRADARSDIYSLACVVYEMLGGEPPHTGPTPKAILARQLTTEVRPLAPIRPKLSSRIDDVLRRALDPTPADRYSSAIQFAEDLAARKSGKLRASLEQVRGLRRQVPLGHVLIAVGVFVVVAVIVGLVTLWPLTVRASEGSADLVVFPFRESGNEASALGEGVPDLLAAALDGTVGIRVADPGSAWRRLRVSGPDPLRVPELDEALSFADRLGASTVVLGSVTAAGGRVVVSARLYDRDGRLQTIVRSAVPAESLGAAVNRLALDVVSAVWERDSLPTVPVIEALATDNIEAMKAYLEARSLSYRGRHAEAQQVINRAVELDTTFALAYLEQFRIRSWVLFQNAQPYVGLREIIDRAMQYRERLSPRNRLMVEANRALDDTDGATAASLLGRVLEIDSVDLDALQGLAFTQLSYGWQIDKDVVDLVTAYRRVLAVDSLDPLANASLARLAVWRGDNELLDESLTRMAAVDTTSPYSAGILGAARVIRTSGEVRDSILRSLAVQPIPVVTTALRDLRTARPDLAERFLAELLTDTMPVFHQRVGLGARTQLWFGEGRVVANDSVVRAGALESIRPVVNRFFVTALLAGVGDSMSAARAVRELVAFSPVDSLEAILNSRRGVWESAWAVAAYHATFGDTTTAHRWRQSLTALPQGNTPWDWTGSLAADLDARLAARGGDLANAERFARKAFDLWTIHSSNILESHPEPAIRFHLAEVLRARGKPREAVAFYRSLAPPHNWVGFYTARASFELGVIAEGEGDLREAAYRYGTALGLWDLGGPGVAEWRRRAREGLQRVVEEIG